MGSEIEVMAWDSTWLANPLGLFEQPASFGAMQRGPDNKIYIGYGPQGDYLHVIHYPDRYGLLCEAEQRAVYIPTYHVGTVPNFPSLRLGPLDGSSCDTLGLDNHPVSRFRYEQDSMDFLSIDFKDLSYYEPTNWFLSLIHI